jgi:phosphate transport system protein
MGLLVIDSLKLAARSLSELNRKLAWQVVLGDNRIDQLEGKIDQMCQEFLVRHMPAGGPLRFVVAAIKVNSELERIGDYADAIARRVVSLHGHPDAPLLGKLSPMFERAITVVETSLGAFVQGQTEKALEVAALEGEVDSFNHEFFEQLSHPNQGETDLSVRFAVLGILNRLERIVDRALNIAEHGIWAARGTVWRPHPRDQQKILFISPADATLGPMAEAIARSKAPLQFTCTSIGLVPAPLNPKMVAFMQKKGIEVVRPRPRGLKDIGPLEDYSVVVLLSQEVEEAAPPLPYRTVQLDWDSPDPARAQPEVEEQVFQQAYEALNQKIADLLDAMAGTDIEHKR